MIYSFDFELGFNLDPKFGAHDPNPGVKPLLLLFNAMKWAERQAQLSLQGWKT